MTIDSTVFTSLTVAERALPAAFGAASHSTLRRVTRRGTVGLALPVGRGLLRLANRFVPLALAVLAPVLINIVACHAFLMPDGTGLALLLLALELYLAWAYRRAFAPMLAARAKV